MRFSAGGHLAGLAALAPGADRDDAVDFAVLASWIAEQSLGRSTLAVRTEIA